jgi:hypothetical protein
MNMMSYNQSTSTIGSKFDPRNKRAQLMSAKTRATPNEKLNCLPKSIVTKSLEADGIKNILQSRKHRLPSAVTTNTQRLKTIETSDLNLNYGHDFQNYRQDTNNYGTIVPKQNTSPMPINSIFNAPLYMQ